MRKSGKGKGEGAGRRGGRYKDRERGHKKMGKIGADTLFDLARKGRYLNQKLVGM